LADWYWYNGGCGLSAVGNGSTITVSPTLTTSYYVRAEGICNTTLCINKIITVNDSSVTAITAISANDTICSGLTTTLGLTGGYLGTSANWQWYHGTCGGTQAGNGSTVTVNPVITTNYYVRAEGVCNTTNCVNFIVTVNDTSAISTGTVTAVLSTICEGGSTTISITGGNTGTGANWYWYSFTCGGNGLGIGSSIVDNPLTTTTYYIRAEGHAIRQHAKA